MAATAEAAVSGISSCFRLPRCGYSAQLSRLAQPSAIFSRCAVQTPSSRMLLDALEPLVFASFLSSLSSGGPRHCSIQRHCGGGNADEG